MLRFLLKSVLFVVVSHCLLVRCAEASIIATPCFTAWVSSSTDLGDGDSFSDAGPADQFPESTNSAPSQFPVLDLPVGANSNSGMSIPPSSSSSGPPIAALVSNAEMLRIELVTQLAIEEAVAYVGPSPSSLLRPPRAMSS